MYMKFKTCLCPVPVVGRCVDLYLYNGWPSIDPFSAWNVGVAFSGRCFSGRHGIETTP